jgi:hypothetical protein
MGKLSAREGHRGVLALGGSGSRSGRTSGTLTPKDGMGTPQAMPFKPAAFNAHYNAVVVAQHAHVPKPAAYVPQPAVHVQKPAAYIPQPAAYVPQPAAHVSQPAAYVPQPAAHVPQPAAYVPQPAAYVPQPTAYVPQPAAHVNYNTSNDLRNPPPAHVRNPAPPQFYSYAPAPTDGRTYGY